VSPSIGSVTLPMETTGSSKPVTTDLPFRTDWQELICPIQMPYALAATTNKVGIQHHDITPSLFQDA